MLANLRLSYLQKVGGGGYLYRPPPTQNSGGGGIHPPSPRDLRQWYIYLMYFCLFDIHVTVDLVIFMLLLVVLLLICCWNVSHVRLFDIHVKIKCNSALGLQCLILINKPFIIISMQLRMRRSCNPSCENCAGSMRKLWGKYAQFMRKVFVT